MKRYLALLMAFLCFASVLALPMEAAAPKIIGKVLTTDIKAYINGLEIPAYNIDGNMVIVGADLRNYGFNVVYDNAKRTSTVTLAEYGKEWTPITTSKSYNTPGMPIGTKVMDVYATDIKVIINGKEVSAYNVDNQMAFRFSELKVFGDYKYDNATRSAQLSLKCDPIIYEGTGSATIQNFSLPSGTYYAICKNVGNFEIYDEQGTKQAWCTAGLRGFGTSGYNYGIVNTREAYYALTKGSYLHGITNGYLRVTAGKNQSWTLELHRIQSKTTTSNMKGTGTGITGMFLLDRGDYTVNYSCNKDTSFEIKVYEVNLEGNRYLTTLAYYGANFGIYTGTEKFTSTKKGFYFVTVSCGDQNAEWTIDFGKGDKVSEQSITSWK